VDGFAMMSWREDRDEDKRIESAEIVSP
jgi:hypothetical protein